MSNQLHQKCDKCGTINTTGDQTWVRLFGAFHGAPFQVPMNAPVNGTPANAVRPVPVDLCPTCHPNLKVSDLIALTPGALAAQSATGASIMVAVTAVAAPTTPVTATTPAK